ncbi:MAG TPA: hypothetical protein PLE61_15915 [Vicinamibacterales bacterium]|nr:hypothetical protein [Vicinamibacterales bacterium]
MPAQDPASPKAPKGTRSLPKWDETAHTGRRRRWDRFSLWLTADFESAFAFLCHTHPGRYSIGVDALVLDGHIPAEEAAAAEERVNRLNAEIEPEPHLLFCTDPPTESTPAGMVPFRLYGGASFAILPEHEHADLLQVHRGIRGWRHGWKPTPEQPHPAENDLVQVTPPIAFSPTRGLVRMDTGETIHSGVGATYTVERRQTQESEEVSWAEFRRLIAAQIAELAEEYRRQEAEDGPREGAKPAGRRPARRGPRSIRQPTFPAMAAQLRALADGPSGRNYVDLTGEEALLHQTPDHQVATKIAPGPILDWFHKPATREALRQELKEAGVPAAFQMAVVVGWALQDAKSLIRRPLDDIAMTVKGRRPKTPRERMEWRREVWRYLLLGECMTNPGPIPGRFTDRETGGIIEYPGRESIYRVFGEYGPEQPSLDGSEPPFAITIGLNPDIDSLLSRDEVLTFFGDVMALAPIPDGQTSGRWARAMGLALNQLFRQRQRQASVVTQGEKNLPAVPFTFTRKDVLVYVAAEVEDTLAGPNPIRAREYWDAAVDLLLPRKNTSDAKRAGVLAAKPREVTVLPGKRAGWDGWRQGWQAFWYEEQRLEFRPGAEGVKAILAMKASAKRKRKRDA